MASPLSIPVRPTWLETVQEAALDPSLPIVDSHHHLYDRLGNKYLLEELLADLHQGHNLRATVFVQARAMLRAAGPSIESPLGETEFANGVAAMSASGTYGATRACAAIVGYADLHCGDAIRPVLERHLSLAGGSVTEGGRFRGVRQSLTWDTNAALINSAYPLSEDMMESPGFLSGISHLAPLGLSFELWVFFHQLKRAAALARAHEGTPMVLNHCGGVLGIAQYKNAKDEVFRTWKAGILEIARCPNVMVKLSGLGMKLSGFEFETKDRAPTSDELAQAWRPWVETCIEAFGADRCMYGSNFPVDKGSCSHGVGLNGLKRIAQEASNEEKADIFWRSAARFYRLPPSSLENLQH